MSTSRSYKYAQLAPDGAFLIASVLLPLALAGAPAKKAAVVAQLQLDSQILIGSAPETTQTSAQRHEAAATANPKTAEPAESSRARGSLDLLLLPGQRRTPASVRSSRDRCARIASRADARDGARRRCHTPYSARR